MYYVYILKSLLDHSHYTGIAHNIKQRLAEHNRGVVKSTKARRPWQLGYLESFPSRIEARKREKFFKSGSGREIRDKLLPM